MTLGEKQELFSRLLSRLITCAINYGYEVRLKHVLRCSNCRVGLQNSVHKVGLAADIVLSVDGYVTWDDRYYNKMHDYWDEIGGAARIPGDLGHFSLSYNGVR